jgi:hypothetical protein
MIERRVQPQGSAQRVPGTPVPVRAGLIVAALLLGVYAINSVVHFGGGVDGFVNKWVYDLFPIICAALCVARGWTARGERWPWLLLGAGMVS